MGSSAVSEDYVERSNVLIPMGAKIERLIVDVIDAEDLAVHSVSHRVKSAPSVEAKISREPGKYAGLQNLHDFLGVRVITHLASDVDTVVEALRRNFQIDDERSLDKQARLDPDRFGYLSFHLIARLSSSRSNLPEWAPYGEAWFEIQVRSILQHAWAEIEHDLGYKSTSIIPPQVRRRFARLAGLLELADSEFVTIASDLAEHSEKVQTEVERGRPVPIDSDAVAQLVVKDEVLRRTDQMIAAGLGIPLIPQISKQYADNLAEHLVSAGFDSTNQVSAAISLHSDALVELAVAWIGRADNQQPEDAKYVRIARGISLFYLSIHAALDEDRPGFFDRMTSLDRPGARELLRAMHDSAFGAGGRSSRP